MLAKCVSCCLILMLSLMEVHSQVCLTQTIGTIKVMGTYSKSNLEFFGYTVRTRLRTRIIERWETHTRVKEIKVCCDGYKKKYYNIDVSGQNCEPICKSNCTNGYCKYPEECACNAGYTKLNDTCEPLCEGGCLHGTCVAPDTCRCASGFNLVGHTCQPVCTEPCENGTCTSPDTCECNPGYYKSKYLYPHTASCKPHCPVGCPLNGHCDAPGKCKCNSGWHLSGNNSKKCVAVCQYPCGNGTCLLPNRCLCAPGFQMNTLKQLGLEVGQVCEPICKDCRGSDCVAPNKCVSAQTSPRSNGESTTSTRNPLETKSTHDYYTTTTTTTTVSYSVGSSSFTDMGLDDDVNTSVIVEYNDTITNVVPADLVDKSWIQRHGMFIWIPLISILIAGLILLLLWRRTPTIIINFFKRRSYNVQGAFVHRNGNGSFESLHFIRDERET